MAIVVKPGGYVKAVADHRDGQLTRGSETTGLRSGPKSLFSNMFHDVKAAPGSPAKGKAKEETHWHSGWWDFYPLVEHPQR